MPRLLGLSAIALGLAMSPIASSSVEAKTVGGAEMSAQKNIVENASKSNDHETLVKAVKAAGLVDTLSGKGPFTVFAPTDAAFDKLPKGTLASLLKPENKDQLAKILTYHVVPTEAMSAAVAKMIKDDNGAHAIPTVAGGKIIAKMKGDSITLTDESGNTAR
ncbi:fasciclin domain-containing protein, partial [bacterium]|nr:fasciclin domain-containing protein [bacterium]